MINITKEPRGGTYRSLLTLAAENCPKFSLTWQDGFRFDDEAEAILTALAPSLVNDVRTNQWPGTTIVGRSAAANVRFFSVSPMSLEVLEAADGLYAWLAPSRPEDLAFYGPDGACWLGSITHEQDAWLELPPSFVPTLQLRVPGLRFKAA